MKASGSVKIAETDGDKNGAVSRDGVKLYWEREQFILL